MRQSLIRASRIRTPRRRRRPGSAGYSLLEVLFSAALLLVISVSILPLFTRAMESNVAGGRATTMSTLVAADIETVGQTTVDHPDWNITSGVADLGTQFYNAGVPGSSHLGEAGWEEDRTDPGLYLWQRSTEVRKYSYADVIPGTVSVGDETTLVTRGHPELYDQPLDDDDGADAANAHVVEFRVVINPDSSAADTVGQRMTVGHYRAY
jgi:hypothetical protein